MTGIADRIMQRVSVHDSGRWVCTPKDFLDLGSREAVDQALSRLVKAGRLRRVGHGLYDRPRISNVLNRPAPVDLDAAITALARRDGVRIMPDGLVAANQLGLTNAVPAKVSYVTDGYSRTLKMRRKNCPVPACSPKRHAVGGKTCRASDSGAAVVGPPRSRGRRDRIWMLNRHLPDDVKLDLLHNSRDLPGWALPLARSIASEQAVAV